MRKAGLIIGGLLAVDGIVALVGGRRILSWADTHLARKAHGRWARLLKRGAHVPPGLLTAWGINNVLAGFSLLLVSTLTGRRTA